MKKFSNLIDENVSKDAERLKHAEEYDLITLPKNIKGTNCGNCKFIELVNEYCKNPKIDQKVTFNMCCALWDADGVKRAWVKD